MDGILNAPTRAPGTGHTPTGKRLVRLEGLRAGGGRRMDDFSRSEGYHAAQPGTQRPTPLSIPSKQDLGRQESLLHTTLPASGGLRGGNRDRKRHASKGRKPSKWRTFRKWLFRSTLIVGLLALLGVGWLVAEGALQFNKIFKGGGGNAPALQSNVKPELLNGEGDGRVNILLLGKGGPGHDGPDLTDTLLVASIDPVNKTMTLVSVPRDLWVTVPGHGSTKINAVYANAKQRALKSSPKDKDAAQRSGVDATSQVISQVLGIPIHYYGMVDFKAFEQAINTVGGVTVNVPEDLIDSSVAWENNGSPVLAKKGMQTFNGRQALLYVRSRHGSARGDFDRTERQRLVIAALSDKVLSAGTYTNPVKIAGLMSAFGDHVSTDLSPSNSLRLMDIGKSINSSKIQSIGLADPPNSFVRTDNVNGQSVVRPTAGFGDYAAIQNFIRNSLQDPYLAKEHAALMVLNGTDTSGLATKKADLLKSYGYNVTTVTDAPTHDYTKTTLIDLTNGKKPFTKNYLEKRLGIKAVTKLPDPSITAQGIDFVVILGQNEL